MNKSGKERLEQYLDRVAELYKGINSWIKEKGLKTEAGNIQINEEASGQYNAPILKILDSYNQYVAEVRPVGAWIIGAEGRIDLIGKLDKIPIIALDKGGPSIITSMSVDDYVEKPVSRPLYRGLIDTPGWYWVEDKLRGKAHFIDKELFLELLAGVSDYD